MEDNNIINQEANPCKENMVLQFLRGAFSDTLFLVICILLTVGAGFNLISGSIDVINVLLTIAFWLIYYTAKNEPSFNIKRLKFLSGIVYAKYVLCWVAVGILTFCGVLFMFLFPIVSNLYGNLLEDILSSYNDIASILGGAISLGTAAIGIIAGIAFWIIAIGITIINIFYTKKAHCFTKSLISSAESGEFQISNAKYISVWFIVMGIFEVISANKDNIIPCLTIGAAYIIGYIWMNKSVVSK